MSDEPAGLEAIQRAIRSAADHDAIAELFWDVGAVVADAAAIESGLVFASVDAMMAGYEEGFGPLIRARRILDEERYAALVADLSALVEGSDTGDGEVMIPSEYLLVVGLKP